ncbi:MAG: hypothetical protein KGM99_15375, partial [Burkholderiales bacterium]|nr:hypothetical protein [Burkholderiales bacterium]
MSGLRNGEQRYSQSHADVSKTRKGKLAALLSGFGIKSFGLTVICLGFIFWIAYTKITQPKKIENFGIAQSNLFRLTTSDQREIVKQISMTGAAWFREALVAQDDDEMSSLLREIRVVNEQGMRFLAVVLPIPTDYDDEGPAENAGQAFSQRCGWWQGSKKLSKLNVAKFGARLRRQLRQIKANGLSIDAFEIGNELDWFCFNGDLPADRPADDHDLQVVLRGYKEFLRSAAEIIRDPQLFPDSKVITFGTANGRGENGSIKNPEKILDELRQLGEFDFVQNSIYRISGVGIHIYPRPFHLREDIFSIIGTYKKHIPSNIPIWVTEWGLDDDDFSIKNPFHLVNGISEFYRNLKDAAKFYGVSIGPAFYYCYVGCPTALKSHNIQN